MQWQSTGKHVAAAFLSIGKNCCIYLFCKGQKNLHNFGDQCRGCIYYMTNNLFQLSAERHETAQEVYGEIQVVQQHFVMSLMFDFVGSLATYNAVRVEVRNKGAKKRTQLLPGCTRARPCCQVGPPRRFGSLPLDT